MNLKYSLLAACVLAAGSTSAFAQSTGDVSIGGRINPGSCTINMANSGVFDYGTIASSTLSQTANTALPIGKVAVNLTCAAPNRVAMTVTDNRNDTLLAANGNHLGLGRTSAGVPIGYYALATVDAFVDGVAATRIAVSADLKVWGSGGLSAWSKTNTAGGLIYRSFNGDAAGPAVFTAATFDLAVNAIVHSRNSLALTKDESIDGSATLEVIYL